MEKKGKTYKRMESAQYGSLKRQEARSMRELMDYYIREMRLVAGLNTQRVFAAWDTVSGAGHYTINRYFKKGVLYCSISSSVVRNRLYFQKDIIVDRINGFLASDELFTKENNEDKFVKEIVLK